MLLVSNVLLDYICALLQHAELISFVIVVQAYSNYGDIIRHTMAKCREISNTAFAKALLLSLQQEFEKLLDDNNGNADTSSKDYTAIKVQCTCTAFNLFPSFIQYIFRVATDLSGNGRERI